jgi:hypothetical protein
MKQPHDQDALIAPYWKFRPTDFYSDVYANGCFTLSGISWVAIGHVLNAGPVTDGRVC